MNDLNIKTPLDLYNYIDKNIVYGFVSTDNKKYERGKVEDSEYENVLYSKYFLQRPVELYKNKYGLCFDQVQFSKYFLERLGYKVHTFYTTHHNHTFIIYEDNNKFIYFETSLKKYNCMKKFNSLNDALSYYIKLQLEIEKDKTKDDIVIYEYNNVSFGSNFYETIDNFKEKIISVR